MHHPCGVQHGPTTQENLALSCYGENAYKGSNIAGIDPETGQLTRRFHPRQDEWDIHFTWNDPLLLGRTAIGRTTIAVLKINLPERVEHRRLLIAGGIVL
jgi:hypothetical protein